MGTGQGRPALVDAAGHPADTLSRPARIGIVLGAATVALVAALRAPAQTPRTQQALLPGPTPYPTQSPPLASATAPQPAFLPFRVHVASQERVTTGLDASGRPVSIRIRQRLLVTGKGDYQLVIGAPVVDVRAAPGSQSEPGLRAEQVLWAGFSAGRKVLAADVTVRVRRSAPYLPVRVRVRREGDRVTLTVTNATQTPEIAFIGAARAADVAGLLDQTRRLSLAGRRLQPAYVTFNGLVSVRKQPALIEAPLRVEGELAVGGGEHVRFARTLGDRRPLSFRVEVRGHGAPDVLLRVRPTNVVRLLQPPGAPTWAATARRRSLSANALLRRLLETRMRLVRSDQYEAFLANPDPAGPNAAEYVFRTAAAPVARARPTTGGSGGGNALLVVLVVVGLVVLAGGAVVAWAHS